MPPPFSGPQPAASRTLGTSGVFNVPDLSPSVDAAILGPVEPRDKVRNLGAAALTALQTQGNAAAHACRQIHGDESLGEAERHRRAAKTSADLILPAQPCLEKALGAYRKSIEELTAMLAGPSIEVSDVQQIEIRSKLSGLAPDKRVGAIIRSVEKGSDLTAAVVLGSDRFLVDFLSDVELEVIRATWARLRHPDEVALLGQRQSDLGHLERGASVMQSWQRKTHNPAIAAALPIGSIQQRGAAGPPPIDRSRSTGFAGIANRARGGR